jgi:hypothetical protein
LVNWAQIDLGAAALSDPRTFTTRQVQVSTKCDCDGHVARPANCREN